MLLGHFVDDFNGVDAGDVADSAHYAVADFFALLGLQTKPSKAQAPARNHVVQGVELAIRPEGVELSPTTKRVEKILGQIDDSLAKDSLSPDEAHALLGASPSFPSPPLDRPGGPPSNRCTPERRIRRRTPMMPCLWAFGLRCRLCGA